MGEKTGISWTNHTANYWWGCQRVSPGCENCYAEQYATVRRKLPVWGPPKTTERQLKKGVWDAVPKWNAAAKRDGVRRRLFVSSMADIFEDHPMVTEWRARALAQLEKCTSLDVQLLTKRPQNVLGMVPPAWLKAWPAHVWIGCTVEDQKRAEERIPELLRIPARVRFLSCEPLLEAIDLTRLGLEPDHHEKAALVARNGRWGTCGGCPRDAEGRAYPERCEFTGRYDHNLTEWISWVIIGGESGSDARTFRIEWMRSLLQQCKNANVAAFCKQFGDNATTTLPDWESWPTHNAGAGPVKFSGDGFGNYSVRGLAHHGADPSEWPVDLRVQQFPSTEE